jgi:hypothetical protein
MEAAMPLPNDYDSVDGEAEAELIIRQAIADSFLIIGAAYGFTTDTTHTRARYPPVARPTDTGRDTTWELISSIVDPDTSAVAATLQTRLMRYFAVSFNSMRRTLRQMTLGYNVKIVFGFKDEYKTDPTQNSFDQITAAAIKFGKYLADNQTLGLDDRVTHRYFEVRGCRFVPADKQGRSASVLDCSITIDLQVC